MWLNNSGVGSGTRRFPIRWPHRLNSWQEGKRRGGRRGGERGRPCDREAAGERERGSGSRALSSLEATTLRKGLYTVDDIRRLWLGFYVWQQRNQLALTPCWRRRNEKNEREKGGKKETKKESQTLINCFGSYHETGGSGFNPNAAFRGRTLGFVLVSVPRAQINSRVEPGRPSNVKNPHAILWRPLKWNSQKGFFASLYFLLQECKHFRTFSVLEFALVQIGPTCFKDSGILCTTFFPDVRFRKLKLHHRLEPLRNFTLLRRRLCAFSRTKQVYQWEPSIQAGQSK